MSHFGDHLIIDCYNCDFVALSDGHTMLTAINGIVEKSKMTLMAEPCIYKAEAITEKDKGGYTAFAIITESHISCHSFPYRGYISIDVYTCRNDLDHESIVEYIKKLYNPKDVDVTVVKRGLKFPKTDVDIK